jgi:hypothetical protein
MATLGLTGPFELTHESIDARVTRRQAGNYALGWVDGVTFNVEYVGRSDVDLNDRLHDWVDQGYSHFKARYARSAKVAYMKECRNFHEFGGTNGLDNDVHPDRPDGTRLQCPFCTH